MSRLSIASIALLASLPFAACGEEATDQQPDNGNQAGGGTAQAAGGGGGTGGGNAASADADTSTPAGTLQALVASVQNQQLGAAWTMLPESYRNDLTGLISEASTKIDPELYRNALSTMNGLVGLLRDKKGMIAELAQQQMGPMGPSTDMSGAIEGISKILGAISGSKHLASTDALASLDMGAFLQDTGASLIPAMIEIAKTSPDPDSKEMLAFFDGKQNFEINEVSADDSHAVLELKFGDNTQDVRMAKVGDHWLPEDLAHGWNDQIADMKQAVAAMEPMTEQEKAQAGAMMGMVDQLVGQLKDCESSAEMMETVQRNPIINMMQSAMGGR